MAAFFDSNLVDLCCHLCLRMLYFLLHGGSSRDLSGPSHLQAWMGPHNFSQRLSLHHLFLFFFNGIDLLLSFSFCHPNTPSYASPACKAPSLSRRVFVLLFFVLRFVQCTLSTRFFLSCTKYLVYGPLRDLSVTRMQVKSCISL